MKRRIRFLSLLLALLTLAGSFYVLWNHGTVSAGFAVIPMMGCLACSALYRGIR